MAIWQSLEDVVSVLTNAGLEAHHYQPDYVPPVALVFPGDPWVQEADGYNKSLIAVTVRVFASTANLETAVEELAGMIETAVKAFNDAFMGIYTVTVEAPSSQPVGTGSFLATDINLQIWDTI